MPSCVTYGTTILVYKKGDESDPPNYRPITCLPSAYKLLTLILYDKIYRHLTTSQDTLPLILQYEQKGCRRKAQCCKDQLWIDKCITKIGKNITINYAWIDYAKAYDSIPHSWIQKVMRLYNINTTTTSFITHAMKSWNTTLHLPHEQGISKTKNIPIKGGIFQGDSLSPLLIWLCLFPIINILIQIKIGFKISNKKQININHLLHIDDMKIYANGKENMKRLLHLLQTFSTDINMTLNLNKCALISIKKGKIENDNDYLLSMLKPNESYKYLGILESSNFHEK